MQLTILLSDMLWHSERGARHTAADAPALARLLARGDGQHRAAGSAAHWLCDTFGVERQDDWPLAPFAWLGEGGAPGDQYWWQVMPVHIAVGRASAVTTPATQFPVTPAEAESLCAALNQHFRPLIAFNSARPSLWYARARAADASKVLARWATSETELQMLLHEHPVNAEREARGEPTLNSLQLFNGGVHVNPQNEPFDAVYSDLPAARGLAAAAGFPLPARMMTVLANARAYALVALAPPIPAITDDPLSWRTALSKADERWFAPALRALRNGACSAVQVVVTGPALVLVSNVRRSDARKFWRRPTLRPLVSDA